MKTATNLPELGNWVKELFASYVLPLAIGFAVIAIVMTIALRKFGIGPKTAIVITRLITVVWFVAYSKIYFQ